MILPEPTKTIGKKGRMKIPPDGQEISFVIEDEITHYQSNMNGKKIFYLQKLQREDGRNDLRLCYYIIGKKPGRKGKWVFGQFAPFIPTDDFRAIFDKAKDRGWI